jgi:hypothetical protein
MIGKFITLLIVYGGLSVAALLLLLVAFAMTRSRAEVIGMAAISGTLVLLHAAELVYLASLGQMWLGDGIDPLLVAGGALLLLAGILTWVFVARGLKRARRSGGA